MCEGVSADVANSDMNGMSIGERCSFQRSKGEAYINREMQGDQRAFIKGEEVPMIPLVMTEVPTTMVGGGEDMQLRSRRIGQGCQKGGI